MNSLFTCQTCFSLGFILWLKVSATQIELLADILFFYSCLDSSLPSFYLCGNSLNSYSPQPPPKTHTLAIVVLSLLPRLLEEKERLKRVDACRKKGRHVWEVDLLFRQSWQWKLKPCCFRLGNWVTPQQTLIFAQFVCPSLDSCAGTSGLSVSLRDVSMTLRA